MGILKEELKTKTGKISKFILYECENENCKKQFKIQKNKLLNNYERFRFCAICRKYHKNCKICDKEIFIQAVTCSKECTYELKKRSWMISCGTPHNFCKNSKSRKKWEQKLLDEEGIINVFQRKSVKEQIKETISKRYSDELIDNISQSEHWKNKVKETCLKRYGVDNVFRIDGIKEKITLTFLKKYGKKRISNGEKISKTRLSSKFKQKMIESGFWLSDDKKTELEIYRYHVSLFTNKNLKQWGNEKFGIDWLSKFVNENKNRIPKDKNSIDHIFSVHDGFKEKIPAYIIGSIINLRIITLFENCKKNKKSEIKKEELFFNYFKFMNENKINKKS